MLTFLSRPCQGPRSEQTTSVHTACRKRLHLKTCPDDLAAPRALGLGDAISIHRVFFSSNTPSKQGFTSKLGSGPDPSSHAAPPRLKRRDLKAPPTYRPTNGREIVRWCVARCYITIHLSECRIAAAVFKLRTDSRGCLWKALMDESSDEQSVPHKYKALQEILKVGRVRQSQTSSWGTIDNSSQVPVEPPAIGICGLFRLGTNV
ncbi:hypothetical protein CPB84DRAFT_1847302 [Gymnopilus junonius]|uniref:Uncharacterized protein n=1 Tax=Gymnopilus junonius TaxID=109634 RepID=A0A9P5NMI9_GYMJU|nr:hypothetical protein CPB84DRAFT_1847302 [Gymnopilus junonius]